MSQALWHINASQSELREVTLTEDDSEQILLVSRFSLISLGTEKTVASACCDDRFLDKMAVPYMEGCFELPVKYGYSLIGAKAADPAQYFHLMHPHQSQCLIDPGKLTPIPESLPADRACLISNMETVINALWDARLNANSKVLIMGFGAIGSLLTITLKLHFDLEFEVWDLDEWKQDKIQGMGLNLWKGKGDFDCVFHTTASQEGLQQAIDVCGIEGKVIELSWYGNKKVELSLGDSFHYGRKSIISSQVSLIPTHMQEEYNYATRKDLAINYLRHPAYDELLSHRIPFSDSPLFFEKLRKSAIGPGLNWLIDYHS
ncbi:MAG: zinc-binding alcohol dehydrogenase [Bacteroidia bacterium]|nr:zinc-binding alcohol dehydrogenase [Bacteroidia bacterium]